MEKDLTAGMSGASKEAMEKWSREAGFKKGDPVGDSGLTFAQAFEATDDPEVFRAKGSGCLYVVKFKENGEFSSFTLLH